MKPIFVLLCFTAGAVLFAESLLSGFRRKYHVIMTQMTWPKAQNYCRLMYTDLATIQTDTDWARLTAEVKRVGLKDRAWVGLYNDYDTWCWSLNDLPLKNISLRRWALRQPDNNNGDESCGYINYLGKWYDGDCTDIKRVICYNASGSGAERFMGVARPLMNWTMAQNYCRTFHTDLASALDPTDNDLLADVAHDQGASWFGLFRDTWKWSDGTNATNLRWSLGYPNNYYNDENCAVINVEKFRDQLCTNTYYVICHVLLPVKPQQMIRLQVKSDGSVFDPNVQSSILEKLKKKLEENDTMKNITVTWKVQPDGNIFHKKKMNCDA